MYIQNATYKAVPTAGLTFPLAEGTVLTVGDVTGIVPENISLAAPTGLIYLATGGTIDLTSEANAGVTFTDAELNALSGDFNFIPVTEAGGSSLPAFTPADKGKILTIGDGTPQTEVVVPEQTWEQEVGSSLHDLAGADWSGIEIGDNVVVTLNGNTFNATVQGNSSRYQIVYGDSNQILYVFSSRATKSSIIVTETQTNTLSVSKYTASVEPKWEAVGLPSYTSADKGKVLTIGEDAEHTTEMTAVPQQDVTEESGEGVITNVDTSLFGEGYAFTMTINNSTYTGAITKESGQLVANVVPDPDGDAYFEIVAGDPNTYFYTNEDGTYSVKLTIAVPNAKDVWDYVKVEEITLKIVGTTPVIVGHETYTFNDMFYALTDAIEKNLPIRVYTGDAVLPCQITVDNNTFAIVIAYYKATANDISLVKELYSGTRGTWYHYSLEVIPSAQSLPNGNYVLSKDSSGLAWIRQE